MSTAICYTTPPKDPFEELVQIFAKGYHRLSQRSDWRMKTAEMRPRRRPEKQRRRDEKKIAQNASN